MVATKSPVLAGPVAPRKGMYWDRGARQWATRIGYDLHLATGERVRVKVQRLGVDPDAAIVQHAQLSDRWKKTVNDWVRVSKLVRYGLPDDIRGAADLSKPVWPDRFVKKSIRQLDLEIEKEKSAGEQVAVDRAARYTGLVDAAKDGLRSLGNPEYKLLDSLTPELRSRLLLALQPSAVETMGFAGDARHVTVEQAKKMYLDDKRSLIGLPEDGIKPGTFQNIDRMLRLALDIKREDGLRMV